MTESAGRQLQPLLLYYFALFTKFKLKKEKYLSHMVMEKNKKIYGLLEA